MQSSLQTAPVTEIRARHRTSPTVFDQRDYLELIEARGEAIRRILRELGAAFGLETAVDAGCGVGFFAELLRESGLRVTGFDGRLENVMEAQQRFPQIAFAQAHMEDSAVLGLGNFDLTLCFGLLYHVENPMLAIRHLRALTRKVLLLESMCVPGGEAVMLLREEPVAEDQSLRQVAVCASEGCLVKMLYRSGFAAVYRLRQYPDHDDFCETKEHARRRTILVATARVAPVLDSFERMEEPQESTDPWSKPGTREPSRGLAARAWRFLRRPRRMQYATLAHRVRRRFPGLPIILRLPFGAWWLARDSALDERLIHGEFEERELRWLRKVVRRGMTFVDAGAHHGLYTLLACKLVGRKGTVVAVEPSARERKRWQAHVRINGCHNAQMAACALGEESGEEDLYVVRGREDWCNSLRPPDVGGAWEATRVPIRRLDDVVAAMGLERVDFLKLDVEGAELSALHGATRTLRESRPAILAEVQDIRTGPWGYAAREIIEYLVNEKYAWFSIGASGSLHPVASQRCYDANLVALPEEQVEQFRVAVGEARQ